MTNVRAKQTQSLFQVTKLLRMVNDNQRTMQIIKSKFTINRQEFLTVAFVKFEHKDFCLHHVMLSTQDHSEQLNEEFYSENDLLSCRYKDIFIIDLMNSAVSI